MGGKYVYRRAKGNSFVFVDTNNKMIRDKKVLELINSIYIAPAYRDVEIHLDPKDKILYTGIDAGGKKQYFYKKFWHDQRDIRKFCKMIDFGKAMPKIEKNIDAELKKKSWNIDKIIALQLKIMILCNFRIGNLMNGKITKSTGISTLKKKHLYYDNGNTLIKFVGKSKIENQCLLKDKATIKLVKELARKRNASDYLFVDKTGKRINALTVNRFLKQYGDFTTKDFRTWVANTNFIKCIMKEPEAETVTARKKNVKESVKKTAEQLHHTPSICKKKYIFPDLLDLYIESPKKFMKEIGNNYNKYGAGKAFIAYMEQKCG